MRLLQRSLLGILSCEYEADLPDTKQHSEKPGASVFALDVLVEGIRKSLRS